jgi:hypothetical protein
MKLNYEINHTSLATLIGDAKNSKSFSERAWGVTNYIDLCEKFYEIFSNKKNVDIECVKKIINESKITKEQSFDNFALDYILEHIEVNSSLKY